MRGTCSVMYQPPSTARMLAGDPASAPRANARFAARALADLPLHRFARRQQARGGTLHRRAHRKIRVGDPLQLLPRFARAARRAAHHDPAQLHLRQSGDLGEAAHGERQALLHAGQRRHAIGVVRQRVVGEDFVGDQRHLALARRARVSASSSPRFT